MLDEVNREAEAIQDGVTRFVETYVEMAVNSLVILCYTPDCRQSAARVAVEVRQRGVDIELVPMRPLVDQGFANRLRSALSGQGECYYVSVLTLELDTMSHFEELKGIIHELGASRCRVIRLISASDNFFDQGTQRTPEQLSSYNATILTFLEGAEAIRVTTTSGSDATIHLEQRKFDWISNRGSVREGAFTILPAGEVATHPANVNGRMVFDGAVNCNVITRLDMRLHAAPITVELRDGRAIDFSCARPDLTDLVGACFDRENGNRVGELGFGTNRGIERFVAENSHLNERRPGVHLGFGQHNQPLDRVPYLADVHLDLISSDGTLTRLDDGRRLDLRSFPVLACAHPANARDEDITGDCCGFGYDQLRVTGR